MQTESTSQANNIPSTFPANNLNPDLGQPQCSTSAKVPTFTALQNLAAKCHRPGEGGEDPPREDNAKCRWPGFYSVAAKIRAILSRNGKRWTAVAGRKTSNLQYRWAVD
ncbi:Hypothetical protein NTJ_05549 [Nesidiocoris tenuis]|uniref:Uncharacterized protein n=1 Tax=Nesidiocoris tenuis TaxID=355587 RepID=A0ABN7AKG2_9HEMI|nr:Hypothetical protein NTJ_05549 [Nesidiocoris tenuis]